MLVAHPEDLIRMKISAAAFRDRPEPKRRQDLDDIAVLEGLRAVRPLEAQNGPGTAELSSRHGASRTAKRSNEPPGRDGPKLGR